MFHKLLGYLGVKNNRLAGRHSQPNIPFGTQTQWQNNNFKLSDEVKGSIMQNNIFHNKKKGS